MFRNYRQIFDKVLFDDRTNVFMHGCLCVALSRVRAANDIRILNEPSRFYVDGFARVSNVVFKSLLTVD